MEAIITVVKQLAVGVLGGLDGLQSMLPGGPQTGGARRRDSQGECYAITSNFEPPSGSPLGIRTADHVIDRVFGAENDLVVPTDGVYQWRDAAAFPPARLHVFSPSSRHQPTALLRARGAVVPRLELTRNRQIRRPADQACPSNSLSELVELTGIEPVTS